MWFIFHNLTQGTFHLCVGVGFWSIVAVWLKKKLERISKLFKLWIQLSQTLYKISSFWWKRMVLNVDLFLEILTRFCCEVTHNIKMFNSVRFHQIEIRSLSKKLDWNSKTKIVLKISIIGSFRIQSQMRQKFKISNSTKKWFKICFHRSNI